LIGGAVQNVLSRVIGSEGMRFAIALTIVAVFLASPLLCVALPCDFTKQTHDCCPKSRGLVACPYDLLETAKASAPAVKAARVAVGIAPTPFFPTPRVALKAPEPWTADSRDLHTRIHVLLI
jgi:hypothetical protein